MKVVTNCYGQEREWSCRREAVDYFSEAIRVSDGAERERYLNIYYQLAEGRNYATDAVL